MPSARHYAKGSMCIDPLKYFNNPAKETLLLCPPFTDEDTDAQRGLETHPKSHSSEVVELSLEPGSRFPSPCSFCSLSVDLYYAQALCQGLCAQ